jgi:hypothetical protein
MFVGKAKSLPLSTKQHCTSCNIFIVRLSVVVLSVVMQGIITLCIVMMGVMEQHIIDTYVRKQLS